MSDIPETARTADGAGNAYLVIRGRGGLLDGEFVKLPLGATITLGRSRRCGFSLKKSARYLLSSGAERKAIRASLSYRAVSRHHCSVTFVADGVVEIENHSPNGSFVDDVAVKRARFDDVTHTAHRVRLGRSGDAFDVEYGSLAPLTQGSISG